MKVGDYIEVTYLETDEHFFSVILTEEKINGVSIFKDDAGLLFLGDGTQYCKDKPIFKCRVVDPDDTYSGWTIGNKKKSLTDMRKVFKGLVGYTVQFVQYGRMFQGVVKKCDGVMMELGLSSFTDEDDVEDIIPFIGTISCGFIRHIDPNGEEFEFVDDVVVSLQKVKDEKHS